MTNKEFIELLKQFPEDATVITSCDYGWSTVKSIQLKEKVEDVICGDYVFNSEAVYNALIINVDKNDKNIHRK